MGASAVSFEFAAPTRIIFGEGRVADVPKLVSGMGSRALVVQGRSGRAESLVRQLGEAGIATTTIRVASEPTISLVEAGLARARTEQCDVVVALGGGSVIDAGKAISALLTNDAPVRDFLEVIGRARPLTNRAAPFIAIPTTAGTGAEVTRNAVLMAEEEQVKVSLRSPLMLPAVALIDPELTYSLPPSVTASTGLDALTQCIEPFVSPHANPLSDAVAREGIRRASTALRRAFHDGDDRDARRDMAVASLCGGLALANAKLGAVHGFASPLCGMFPVPHGVVCARLLPLVTEVNVRALRVRAPNALAVARYDDVARVVTGDAGARAEDAVAWLRDLVAELAVPGLASYGVRDADIPRVVAAARQASSMQGNPIVLTDAELHEALGVAIPA
ncbi:MAG TPA: iron-containing alcohol dehydrogenase [Gemmatimonadaceae bacterium]|nr:iron-containing alcohol dehydrogenase [Gemmatimonadaceae bacterium]